MGWWGFTAGEAAGGSSRIFPLALLHWRRANSRKTSDPRAKTPAAKGRGEAAAPRVTPRLGRSLQRWSSRGQFQFWGGDRVGLSPSPGRRRGAPARGTHGRAPPPPAPRPPTLPRAILRVKPQLEELNQRGGNKDPLPNFFPLRGQLPPAPASPPPKQRGNVTGPRDTGGLHRDPPGKAGPAGRRDAGPGCGRRRSCSPSAKRQLAGWWC